MSGEVISDLSVIPQNHLKFPKVIYQSLSVSLSLSLYIAWPDEAPATLRPRQRGREASAAFAVCARRT